LSLWRMRRMKLKYVPDGVYKTDRNLYTAYASRVSIWGKSFCVVVPKEIARKLGIKLDDILEVLIRKITPEEALKLYNYSISKYRRRKLKTPRVTCPVCGKKGYIWIIRKNNTYNISIRHGKSDGFDIPTEHYVSKRKYPEFYEEMLKKYVVRKVE